MFGSTVGTAAWRRHSHVAAVRETATVHVDVALVGGGGAGLSLLHRLGLLAARGVPTPSVAVVDPVDRLRQHPNDRTWCFWDLGRSDVEPAVHRAWRRVLVVGHDRRRRVLDLAPHRYVMLRSQDYSRLVASVAGPLDVVHVAAAAEAVEDGEGAATVCTGAGDVRASWVLDSRPAPPVRPASTLLLQHFRGQVVRADRPVLDPDLPVLMDFTTPQPDHGLSFGYCLPSDERTGLIEYTEFSPALLDEVGYARALEAYVPHVLGGDVPHAVQHVEQGVIPMTDARFPRRVGRRVFRLGTAAGATRPSTGYAFAAMQRQAQVVAERLARGDAPLPPRSYPRRHLWMDGLVLRGLATGTLDGPAFFARLFDRNPPSRVLSFLDGLTSPAAEVAVMATAPRAQMLRLAALDAAARTRRLLPG